MSRDLRLDTRPTGATPPRSSGGFRRAISGAAIAIGVLGAWAAWLRATPMGRAGSGRDDGAEDAEPGAEGERERSDERASAPSRSSLPALSSQAPAVPPADPDERPAPGGERDRTEASRAAQAARYERAAAEWTAQPYDRTWAPEAEASVRRALGPRLGGVSIEGKLAPVACRSTWCVLDIEAPSSADLAALDGVLRAVSADLAPQHGSAPSARLSDPGADGTPRRARYFLRFRRP